MITVIKVMRVKPSVGTYKGEINFKSVKDRRYVCANPL